MKILFVCTGNACRSQIAEGYAKRFGDGFCEIQSAGLVAHGVNPRAVQTMKEIGIDISQQQSKVLTKEMLEWADLVITLCGHADEHCPVLPPNKQKRHYPFEDPAKATGDEAQIMKTFAKVRDEIGKHIATLMDELKPTKQWTPKL
ncbi:MAG: arsenate reductase (thioredoxin) [Gammaproteobacteria bacterium]|nr:arsenate reductase (thioredoxin) [Gammaproteobacteria bacterium]